MIRESFNNKYKVFVYEADCYVDPNVFRVRCFKEFSVRVYKINHVVDRDHFKTVGFSNPIY